MFQSFVTVELIFKVMLLMPSAPVLVSSSNLTVAKDLNILAELSSLMASDFISIKMRESGLVG